MTTNEFGDAPEAGARMTSESPRPSPIYDFAHDGCDRGENPLVLGFAYSLNADGTPGLYNQILAQAITRDWTGRKAWIGVQWEIMDAMKEPNLATTVSSQLRPHKPTTDILLNRLATPATQAIAGVHVAPPFDPIDATTDKGKDALDWRGFRQLLIDSLGPAGDPAVARLANTMANLARKTVAAGTDAEVIRKAITSPQQLAVQLNQLVRTDKDLYKRFWGKHRGALLQLHGRPREGFGPVGFEYRELPPRASQSPLGDYQTHRVNRLILDAICPDRTVLPEPRYLSTKGVLENLYRQMGNRPDCDRIFIYASPVHSGRCERQFLEFAYSQNWTVDFSQIQTIFLADDMAPCGWIWQEGTSQVWCRSKAAWEAYEEHDARLR